MDTLAFEHHLTSPQGAGHHPHHACTITRNGGTCGDEITFSVVVDGDRVLDAGYSADGCGTSHAAGSAAVELVRGATVLDAARVGAAQVAAELGGLSPGKLHAAELAADALARALGRAIQQSGRLSPPDPAHPATLVAMSSGVDSTVAAQLCAAGGAATYAVTLELWADPENDAESSCCSSTAVAQARALAHRMGLPHFTLDLREPFRTGVVQPFIDGYAAGETPNPCIGCNGHVRLDAMLDFADRLGCASLATGHYARVAEANDARGPLLRAAADPDKDQTYMLAALDPASLARMRFPLGELTKPQVRALAAQAQLPVADKADSQDLCFLAGTDRPRFLARHGGVGDSPGEIVATDGTVLGTHAGQHRFTVGQRRGIGIHSHDGTPLFVIDKDAGSGRVTVGPRTALLTDTVRVRGARLHRDGARVDRVKLRYRSRPLPARVHDVSGGPDSVDACGAVGSDGTGTAPGRHRALELELGEAVDGAAPGQLACLMDGELIVGWGTITRG